MADQEPVGASSLTIDIPEAYAKPPDVAVQALVPPNQNVPLTPIGPELINRNQAAVRFHLPDGFAALITRIHVQLPVYLQEHHLETHEEETEELNAWASEEEARQAAEGKGGEAIHSATTQPLNAQEPYQRINTERLTSNFKGKESSRTHKIKTERSVLPTTPQVTVALIGPEGTEWSDSFDAPCSYYSGEPSEAIGLGLINSYTDLTNPISTQPGRSYGLALGVRVPSLVSTFTQLGLEASSGTTEQGSGGVTFIYDIVKTPIGK